MLTPMGVTAARLALERDGAARWRRLVAAARDGARERVRPSPRGCARSSPRPVAGSPGGTSPRRHRPARLLYGRNAVYRVGRTHARTVIPRVLELMTEGRLHPETVTTTLASLDDAPGVLFEHVVGDGTKTILTA
jgi:alcohol dehydrogenase